MNKPTLPTIHLNGSGAANLEQEYRAVRLAVAAAVDALERATCNYRDFYPQGPDTYNQARAERERAFQALDLASAYAEAWEAHAHQAQQGGPGQ